MCFVHFLARRLNFILHSYYIPVYIISLAVQHVPWTLDFRPSALRFSTITDDKRNGIRVRVVKKVNVSSVWLGPLGCVGVRAAREGSGLDEMPFFLLAHFCQPTVLV